MGAVLHLGISEQQHIVEIAVVEERIAPGLLVLGCGVDFSREEKGLAASVIPSSLGRKHILILPEIGRCAEYCLFCIGVILQDGGFDKDGIRKHIHIPREGEQFSLGIVGSVNALYYLPVLVLHRGSLEEGCHTVGGVVVQVACAQGVVLLVQKLHNPSAELGKVVVHIVVQSLACKHGAFLH